MKCNKDLRETGRSKQKIDFERIKKQRDETETEADGKVTEADRREGHRLLYIYKQMDKETEEYRPHT